MWRIEPQEEGRGDNRHEVLCKHVEYRCSEDPKTGEKKFGRLKTPVLRVLVTDGSVTHKLTWSNSHNQPMSGPSPGTFSYRWPDKLVYKTFVVGKGKRRKVCEDTLSPKVKKPGEAMTFESHTRFWAYLIERLGPQCADEVQAAFTERLAEWAAAKAA